MDVQLDQFRVGDVLRVVGELEELIIQKIWLTTQGPYRWVDYETQARRSRRRVIVGAEYDDGEWETVVYDQFLAAHEVGDAAQLPASLEWNGKRWRREEQGRCTVRLVGDDGPTLPCTYADYAGSGDDVLAVEVFEVEGTEGAAEVEVFVGRSVVPSDVELYLPVDTAPRTSLLRSTGGRTSAAARVGQPSMTQRQIVIVAVVLAIVVLFAIMALS
jgi:hypothetical protein